jgi:multisubunit Na+/H+ antiporter MnhB subunit
VDRGEFPQISEEINQIIEGISVVISRWNITTKSITKVISHIVSAILTAVLYLMITLGLIAIAYVAVKEPQSFNKSVEKVGTFIYFGAMAFMVGALLYGMRLMRRRSYGVLEICAGTVTVVFALFEASQSATANSTLADLLVYSTLLKIAGGLYIIVRGLDNIGESLSEPYKSRWKGYFKFLGSWPCG